MSSPLGDQPRRAWGVLTRHVRSFPTSPESGSSLWSVLYSPDQIPDSIRLGENFARRRLDRDQGRGEARGDRRLRARRSHASAHKGLLARCVQPPWSRKSQLIQRGRTDGIMDADTTFLQLGEDAITPEGVGAGPL